MQNDDNAKRTVGIPDELEIIVKKVVSGISPDVRRKYDTIKLDKIPDHVNYSKVDKYLRSVNIEVTRRMFITYLKDSLLPAGHEIKNSNYSYYTREQIIYYILVDMFKPILPLNKVQVFFGQVLKPMIESKGLDSTFNTLRDIVDYMVEKLEEAIAEAVADEGLRDREMHDKIPDNMQTKEEKDTDDAIFSNLVTLCTAKGARDLYKYSPDSLLE